MLSMLYKMSIYYKHILSAFVCRLKYVLKGFVIFLPIHDFILFSTYSFPYVYVFLVISKSLAHYGCYHPYLLSKFPFPLKWKKNILSLVRLDIRLFSFSKRIQDIMIVRPDIQPFSISDRIQDIMNIRPDIR